MRRRRLLWQLYPSYLLITVLAVVAVTWFASRSLRDFHMRRTAEDLRVRCLLFQHELAEAIRQDSTNAVDRLCKQTGVETGARFTFILPSGVVAGDSERPPAAMDNHAAREEVAAALSGRTGEITRYSDTLRENMMYVAIPVRDGSTIAGVVRCALPLTTIEQHLRFINRRILMGGAVAALLAALVSLIVSRRISRPLEQMERGAARFARGDLSTPLPTPATEEMARLASALNRMASQLDERLRVVLRESDEKMALFAGMDEGVIAVDTREIVKEINAAAARLLDARPDAARGRTLPA